MKSTILIALPIYITSFFSPLYAEEIRSFYVEMLISKDGSISVQEDIEYDFGDELKHGIIREIPYKYEIGIKNYNLRMHVARVTNFDGVPYKSRISRNQGRLIVKIGDPDKFVVGSKNYRIDYFVDGAITFFKDYDEIYWNVTGNEWRVPIKKASAKVYFDQGVRKNVTAKCYTGVFGSKEEDCRFNITANSAEFDALRGLVR